MTEKAPRNYQGRHQMPKIDSKSRGYQNHVKQADGMYLTLPAPGDRELLVQKGGYRELMTHDGTSTYLVHSTTPEQAKKILEEGMNVLGTDDSPKLESTVVMLAGPNDRDQAAKNAFNLAYQYDGGNAEQGDRTAKVVFQIPKPTPDIELGRTSFTDTHLAEADGVNIVKVGPAPRAEGPDDTLYAIPAERAMGYIDLTTADMAWQPNEAFEHQLPPDPQQALGDIALRQ